MYNQYHKLCLNHELLPGGLFLWKESRPWIANLATQKDLSGARMEWVESALNMLRGKIEKEGIESLAIPQIAAGLGGLDWDHVRQRIEGILGDAPIPIFVYDRYIRRLKGDEAL